MNRFTDLALDKNALDFQDLFQEVLSQKVSDALDAKKVEIAATMFEDPAIAEEKIEMTRGGRATGNAIADIVAKNNARLAKQKADRAKHLRKKEKYDGGVKEEVEQIDELDISTVKSYYKKRTKEGNVDYGNLEPNNPKSREKFAAKWKPGSKRDVGMRSAEMRLDAHKLGKNPKAHDTEYHPAIVKKKIKSNPAISAYHEKGKAYGNAVAALKKKHGVSEEVELDEGMVDHIAKVHVHGSNVTLHLDNGKKSTQKHPSPEAALKDGKAWHKATGREAKLVVSE